MTKVRCAIVDDEQPARELLVNFAARIPTLEVVGMFKSPLEVIPLIHEQKIDLLFLDIQMPDISGVDFLKSIRNVPEVIFTTAYSEYALEGYDLDVRDYLLKPFSFDRFLKAYQKVYDHSLQKDNPRTSDEFLNINADHRIYRVRFDDILYIEGMREYVAFHTRDGNRIIALQSMKMLEETLPPDFIRTHRSYIVRLDRVKFLEGNTLKLHDREIPVGASYKDKVLESLK